MKNLSEKLRSWWYTGNLHESRYERPMVFIVPSYNNALWYRKNLDSILQQKYSNFRVIYIDDCSIDGTGELVKNYLAEHPRAHLVNFIGNAQRLGVLENLYTSIHTLPDKAIVLIVDGDDWLAHDYVCSIINRIYENEQVWLTYGNYIDLSDRPHTCYSVPACIIKQCRFRSYHWVFSQLRTYYAGLFKRIKYDDLLHDGNFYAMSGDVAIMYPMLEMAGDRSKFIKQKLYVYNTHNPLNDFKVDIQLQQSLAQEIRQKPSYAKLDRLF